MNFNEVNRDLCRICLKSDVFFEWIEAIFEFSGPSYKECYFQFTHLHQEDEDPYTQMLCHDCANDLRNTYQFVEKAIASYKQLKELQTYNSDKQVTLPDNSDLVKEDEFHKSPTDVIMLNTNLEDKVQNAKKQKEKCSLKDGDVKNSKCHDSDLTLESDSHETPALNMSNQIKKKVKHRGLPLMCMHCSKICYSRSKLVRHELTHENRKRTETCPICGLKFFDKVCLKFHMEIHTENRERKFKCEFCIKSFFQRAALNIHRRIHLEQMIKCKFCTKQFYRQIDLDRHMQSHNIARLTGDGEKKSKVYTKYFVDCKTCGQKVNWQSWDSHNAKHLNLPQFECRICNKTYYTRKSMKRHLKQIHDISADQYDKFVIRKNRIHKPRLTTLMKKENLIMNGKYFEIKN